MFLLEFSGNIQREILVEAMFDKWILFIVTDDPW